MDLEKQIQKAIETQLANIGFEVVSVKISEHNRDINLSIKIDKIDESTVSMGDCVECTKLVSTLLDVENFIEKGYTLEVSSPGEYRPLIKIRDYERFAGLVAKVELKSEIDGLRKFRGKIVKITPAADDAVIYFSEVRKTEKIEDPSKLNELSVNFSDIAKATAKRIFSIK